MLVTAGLAILAVVTTVIGVWDKIRSGIRSTIIVASLLVAASLVTPVILVAQKREQQDTIDAQEKIIKDRKTLMASGLSDVDEASGGAVVGNEAYIVDDDVPSIFVLKYSEAEGKYQPKTLKPERIIDARPCNERLDWDRDCNDAKPTVLTRKLIEDFEGAATYNNKLYLITSHSIPNSQTESSPDAQDDERKRSLFLEVSLKGEVLRATRKLKPAILDLLRSGVHKVSLSNKLEEVQIEGLTIDKHGMAYLGFRSPLVKNCALVLRASVEQLFTDKPNFEAFVLNLANGEPYGITSLDYDPKLDQILVLGNSPDRENTFTPVVWSWTVGDDARLVQPTTRYNGEIFSVFEATGARPLKPEVILQPKENRIHLFFDAEGLGGQVALLRKDGGLFRSDN